MGNAVEPLEQGNGRQFGQPDLEGLAKQRHERRVVGRSLAHLIDQVVEIRVAPAPEIRSGRAGGLDVAAVVEGEVFLAVQFPDSHVPNIDGFDDDWSAVPLDVYAIPSSRLFSVHGFAGDDVPRGGMDPASMQIRHILGWNDSRNEIYVTTRIFDNKHTITRQDLGSYWWDDSIEIEFNPRHDYLPKPEDVVTHHKYSFAFPPLNGNFGPALQTAAVSSADVENPTLLSNGSRWYYCTYSFEGEEYGESTYIYEFRTIAIDSYPKPTEENITEDQVIEHDLTAGEVIGFSIFVSDVDDSAGDADNRVGMWATTPTSCCHSSQDLLISPMDDTIDWGEATAVEAQSWGRIKHQYQQ